MNHLAELDGLIFMFICLFIVCWVKQRPELENVGGLRNILYVYLVEDGVRIAHICTFIDSRKVSVCISFPHFGDFYNIYYEFSVFIILYNSLRNDRFTRVTDYKYDAEIPQLIGLIFNAETVCRGCVHEVILLCSHTVTCTFCWNSVSDITHIIILLWITTSAGVELLHAPFFSVLTCWLCVIKRNISTLL